MLKFVTFVSANVFKLTTMKILEWKSFAIGVLLTTTVVLGTGASKPTKKNLLEKIEILVRWTTTGKGVAT